MVWGGEDHTSPPLFVQENTMLVHLLTLLRNTRGATAIEYGLIAALIAVAAISAMQGLGNNMKRTFNNVSSNLKTT
jgi:pilus assembly protein Flp/PilA